VSTDVVSAEKAQQVISAVNAACELGGMSSNEEAAALTMESLARTVIALHAREAAQATELAVLRAQLAPLLAVHDALVAAAALPGAGASGEAMVAAVRAKAWAEGVEAMRSALDNALVTLACCAEVDAGLGADRDEEQTTKASAFDRALAMLRAMPTPRAALIPLPGAEVSRG
jgi:hypothetical protein